MDLTHSKGRREFSSKGSSISSKPLAWTRKSSKIRVRVGGVGRSRCEGESTAF